MMLSLFLSRVLGIVRDTVMVAQFGQGAQTDAYVLAFLVPDLIFFLIAGGALSSAFIPVFSEFIHTDREDDAWKLFSVVVTLMSLLVAVFILVAWIFAEPLTRLLAGAKGEGLIPLIAHMSRIVLPAQYAFLIGGILFGTLYSRQRFAAPGLGPNVYNLGIIFGALVLSTLFDPGILGMAWGALLGAFIGNLAIPLLAMRAIQPRFQPSLDLSHPGVKKVLKLMLPVVLGLSLPGVYALIMHVFGTVYGMGINTALNLSNKLMQAPLGIFGQSLAIAAFPALSQFFAQQRMDLYRQQLSSTLRTVLYITLPISALMIALAPEVVALAFEYGKATASDTAATARCLQMFGIGIAAWCLHPVLMRGFFAMQQTVTPIVLGTGCTVLFVVLVLVLRQTPLTYASLPLASSLSAIVLVLVLLAAVSKQAGGIDLAGLSTTFAKAGLAAAAMGLALWMGTLVMPQAEGLGRNARALVLVGGLGLAGAWLYYGLTRLMRMPETQTIDRALARLSRRRSAD